MEVNLDRGQIPNLIEFVDHLSLTMHSSVPGSLVLWWVLLNKSVIFLLQLILPKVYFDVFSWFCRYDSVTVDGKLNWQDQLNEHNKPFFDICDGIFVNYTWKVLFIFPWHAGATLMFDPLSFSLFNFIVYHVGRLSKALCCCCKRAEVWCVHGNRCIWKEHIWWWTVECKWFPYAICYPKFELVRD